MPTASVCVWAAKRLCPWRISGSYWSNLFACFAGLLFTSLNPGCVASSGLGLRFAAVTGNRRPFQKWKVGRCVRHLLHITQQNDLVILPELVASEPKPGILFEVPAIPWAMLRSEPGISTSQLMDQRIPSGSRPQVTACTRRSRSIANGPCT